VPKTPLNPDFVWPSKLETTELHLGISRL